MKLLLFYTSHRQLDEIGICTRFASRFSAGLRSADLVLHCNNPEISKSALESLLSGFPNGKKELIHTSKNIGFRFGHIEAVADCYPLFLEQQYDWVLHFHPDVFVTNEKKVLDAIAEAERSKAGFLCFPLFEDGVEAYTTDFFAWKPSLVPKAAFEAYLEGSKDGIIPEVFLFRTIQRLQIPCLSMIRYRGRGWQREIDKLGLWHPHNNSRADFYLRTGIYVPLGEYKTVENFFRRQYRRVFQKTAAKIAAGSNTPSTQA